MRREETHVLTSSCVPENKREEGRDKWRAWGRGVYYLLPSISIRRGEYIPHTIEHPAFQGWGVKGRGKGERERK